MNVYHSFRFKLVVMFFLLISTPFIISSIITYKSYTRTVEKKVEDYSKQLTSQIGINLDNYLNDIFKLLMVYFSDKNVTEIMNKHGNSNSSTSYVPSYETNRLYSSLSTIVYDRPEIEGIFVFCKDGVIFSDTEDNGNYNKQLSDYWNDFRPKTDTSIVIVPPHSVSYYSDENKHVFSVMRTIKSTYNGEFIGMIKVDIGSGAFEKLVTSANFTPGSNLIIADAQNNIYYPVEKWGCKLEDLDKANERDEILKWMYTSSTTGIKVYGLFQKQYLQADAKKLVWKIAVISFGALLIALILAIMASNKFMKPIGHLKQKMEDVQNGKLWTKSEINTHDELELLSDGFNSMVERIRVLIQEVGIMARVMYEVKVRQRNAELSALQSQLNPHFLYNTLEHVNMIALESNQFEICTVTSNLGKLLRYTVNKSQNTVLLKEELQFVGAYLKIISLRLGDGLQTEVYVDPDLQNCLVPKLIIQPLVENVIKHGLVEDRGIIRISIKEYKDKIFIRVADNGVGMSLEKIAEVKARIYAENEREDMAEFGKESSGYALRNAHRRLRLLYGEEYGMSIISRPEKGAAFILKLPKILKEVNKA